MCKVTIFLKIWKKGTLKKLNFQSKMALVFLICGFSIISLFSPGILSFTKKIKVDTVIKVVVPVVRKGVKVGAEASEWGLRCQSGCWGVRIRAEGQVLTENLNQTQPSSFQKKTRRLLGKGTYLFHWGYDTSQLFGAGTLSRKYGILRCMSLVYCPMVITSSGNTRN